MSATVVKHSYVPRPQLAKFHVRTQRWALIVAHRRFGKTVGVVNDMVVRAARTKKKNAFYAYIAPTYGQAKNIAWVYIKDAVRNFPPGTVKISESETSIRLPNGAKIRVFGVDNPDALRGLFFDGVICDEFGEWEGRAWTEVIRPALADRQGWAVFIGTPKGPSNKFAQMRERAMLPDSGWFYIELKGSQTGILPQSELDALKQELDPEEYEQEIECSFQAAVKGSYYGSHIAHLEALNKICDVNYSVDEPVFCALDIGTADATACWFWQVIDGQVRFFDYFEATDLDAGETMDMLELKPYRYEVIFLPHDAKARHWGSKKTGIETMVERNAPIRIVPKQDLKDTIDAVRKTLRTYPVIFDKARCAQGIKCLRNYSRQWNKDGGVYSNKPIHDHWSNGADAFRYACLNINQTHIQKSIEKARAWREQAAHEGSTHALGSVNTSSTNSRWTLSEALAHHQRQQRARMSQGEKRV